MKISNPAIEAIAIGSHSGSGAPSQAGGEEHRQQREAGDAGEDGEAFERGQVHRMNSTRAHLSPSNE